MCLKWLWLVMVMNSLSECSIIICLAINLLWMWIMTFWLHIVSSLHYKVSRYAWPYETLCLAVIGWNPTQASIGTLWQNVLSECTVAKLSYFFLLWSASMFLGCLPQCPIYVVTGKVLCGWPLIPCMYNNRITINVLYFSPEQVVSRCLLKLQRPLS